MAQWGAAAKSDNGSGVVKKTSQRSLLFRQNVNRTEAEWVHFLDGYRKALIEFDMKKFGDDDNAPVQANPVTTTMSLGK